MKHPFAIAWCCCAVIASIAAAVVTLGVRVNFTASMPPGLYRVVSRPIERGATVTVCLDKHNAVVDQVIARGYFAAGPCPSGIIPFLKTVAAVPGDLVELDDDHVAVNGRSLPNTALMRFDGAGLPLPHVPRGQFRLKAGQLLLMATHSPYSFDGRYFGPSRITDVVDVVTPVFTAS